MNLAAIRMAFVASALSAALGISASAQAACSCPVDVNTDGTVNIDDLVRVITGWGACP